MGWKMEGEERKWYEMKNRTLGEEVYITLKDWIITGRLKPGERLMYNELRKQLNISNTPLKEAFFRLEREGLVTIVARRGTFVRSLSNEDIINFYQIREVLEGLSARLASYKAKKEDLEELRKICDYHRQVIDKSDSFKCMSADIQFHDKIVEIAGNSHLTDIIKNHVLTNLFMVTGLDEVYLKRGLDVISRHEKLIKAIESGDGDRAEKVMRQQIRDGADWILNSIKNRKI